MHVRFEGLYSEMASSGHGGRFAAGVSLGSLHMETTNRDWEKTGWSVKGEGKSQGQHLVYKLLEFSDLCAYVDPNALHFIHSSVHDRVIWSTLHRLREMGSGAANVRWWNHGPSVHMHR